MSLQLLKQRTLTFNRPDSTTYLADDGEWVEATSSTTFDARGSLQPISNNDKKAIQNESGVRVKKAYYFYTKTSGIRTIDDDAAEPDYTTIDGRRFEAWANSPWDGPLLTDHNVITLVRVDEVANV